MGEIIPFKPRPSKEVSSAEPTAVNPHELAKSPKFLQKLKGLSGSERRIALRDEASRICTELANAHRLFVSAKDVPEDPDMRYAVIIRLEEAVQRLTTKLGRATLFNFGGVVVHFNNENTVEWIKRPWQREAIGLTNDFTVQQLTDLLAPKLKPATEYLHEMFDVSDLNHR